jgi:general stress protein 26
MSNGDAGQGGKKLRRLIKGIRVAMLTTVSSNGTLRSRPMATIGSKDPGELWFFTRAGSPKSEEIRDNQRVNLSYADVKGDRFVSVSGTASIVRDPQRIKELWDRSYRTWFPLGKKDPDLALLRVGIDQAEYWDSASARLVQLMSGAKAAVSGEAAPPVVENRKLDMPEIEGSALPPLAPTTRGGAQG